MTNLNISYLLVCVVRRMEVYSGLNDKLSYYEVMMM